MKHPKFWSFIGVLVTGLITAAGWYTGEVLAAFNDYQNQSEEGVDLRDTLSPDYD